MGRPERPLNTRRSTLLAGASAALLAPFGTVRGSGDDPTRPIQVIVPFPAGGTTDHLMRALAGLAEAELGQPLVVHNRPGGSTLIAARSLAHAPPDGSTIGVVPLMLNRLRALGRSELDVVRDFSLIACAASQCHGLVARTDTPHRTLADVVQAARRRPGAITYGTSGVASHTHVAMEDLAFRAGIEIRHIPYRGGVQSLKALLAGEVDLIAESPLWQAAVDAGRCRLLAALDERRMPRYPRVPTFGEQGYPVSVDGSIGLGGPPGLPAPIRRRLGEVFHRAILSPAFDAACRQVSAQVLYLDGEAFAAHARQNDALEVQRVRRLGHRLSG